MKLLQMLMMSVSVLAWDSNEMIMDGSLPIDPSVRGSDFVRSQIEEKLEPMISDAMLQINSVLMLNSSNYESRQLGVQLKQFKAKLAKNFEQDLLEEVEAFKSSGRQITQDEKYAMAIKIQKKWQNTLTSDVKSFQNSRLQDWFDKVKNVWKGIEKKVENNIEKFKKFVHKTSPRSADTCELPKPFAAALGNDYNLPQSVNKRQEKRGLLLELMLLPVQLFLGLVIIATCPIWVSVWFLIILIAVLLDL